MDKKFNQRKQLLTSFLEEVWSLGEIEACDRFVGSTYTIQHDPGDPWDGRTLDREAFKDRVRQSRAPFPDQRFHIQSLLEDDRKVAVAWTWTATHAGDLPGFPATGRILKMSGLTIYEFDGEGLLSGHWQVSDRPGHFSAAAGRKCQCHTHTETEGKRRWLKRRSQLSQRLDRAWARLPLGG